MACSTRSMQHQSRIVFVTDFIPGGDLMLHIQRSAFSVERAWYAGGGRGGLKVGRGLTAWPGDGCGPGRIDAGPMHAGGDGGAVSFYAAEVLLALECLHRNNVIYRCGDRPGAPSCDAVTAVWLIARAAAWRGRGRRGRMRAGDPGTSSWTMSCLAWTVTSAWRTMASARCWTGPTGWPTRFAARPSSWRPRSVDTPSLVSSRRHAWGRHASRDVPRGLTHSTGRAAWTAMETCAVGG